MNLENIVPYNSNELDRYNFRDLERLLHYTQFVTASSKDNEFYLLKSSAVSQFLQLARNYPYIYNSDGEPLFAKVEKIYFAIMIKKSNDYHRPYLLKGSLYTRVKVKEQIHWKPFPKTVFP